MAPPVAAGCERQIWLPATAAIAAGSPPELGTSGATFPRGSSERIRGAKAPVQAKSSGASEIPNVFPARRSGHAYTECDDMRRCERLLVKLEEIVVGSLLAAMSGATFMNVVARYVLNSPIDWAEEFSRYAFIWLAFMAAAVASARKRQITIDLLISHLPSRGQFICRVVVDLATLALMAAMAYYGWLIAQNASSRTATLGIPRSWIYISAPVAAVLIFCHTLVDFATGVLKLGGGDTQP